MEYLMGWLLEYEKVISLIINGVFMCFTIFIGFKGLSTVKDHFERKEAELNAEHNYDEINKAKHQFDKLIRSVSSVHSSISKMTYLFYDFESKNILSEGLDELLLYLKKDEVRLRSAIFDSYLIDGEFMNHVRRYHHAVKDFWSKMNNVMIYTDRNGLLLKDVLVVDELFDDNDWSICIDRGSDRSDILMINQLVNEINSSYREIEKLVHNGDYSDFIKDLRKE